MQIIGCDVHDRQQTLAMLDTTTRQVMVLALRHEGDNVREFYSSLPRPVRVGIEATRSMQWFVNLMDKLIIECLVGHPAMIRAAEQSGRRSQTSSFLIFPDGSAILRNLKNAAVYVDGFLLCLPVFVNKLAFLPRNQKTRSYAVLRVTNS
jgi:hypothetical protein